MAVALLVAIFASAARADVRQGSVDDARDGYLHESVDGSSYYDQDIQHVDVTYDTAGRLQIGVRFYDPLPASTSSNILRISVGSDTSLTGAAYDYCLAYSRGDASVTLQPDTTPTDGSISLDEIEGTIPFTATPSSDGHGLAIDVTHPALANRAYKCVAVTFGYSYEHFHCTDYGCYDYDYHTTDATSAFRLFGPGGYAAPAPPSSPGTSTSTTPPSTTTTTTTTDATRQPACWDDKDNDGDGTTDLNDPGCADMSDDSEAPFNIPTLAASDAKRYMRSALDRRFGDTYFNGYAHRLRPCHRVSRLRYRCTASWVIGDYDFVGPVTIWLTSRVNSSGKGKTMWNYAYTMRRFDEYCADRKLHGDRAYRGKRCVKTYHVS